MNEIFKQLTLTLLPYFLPLFLLGLLSLFFYRKIVGRAGEFYVKNELRKLPKNNYFVINDLMVRVGSITHQIDHVVISKFGIFVIETKQYNGYVVGNEFDKKWHQNNKYLINNPIHQNYGHIKSLEEVLDLGDDKFISIVCIPSTAKIKVISKSHVLRLFNLNSTILSYNTEIIDDYREIYMRLLKLNISDRKERRNHVKSLKNINNSKDEDINNKCPNCGGELVVKKGKYGKFVGCFNYPKCKYTKKDFFS